MGYLVMAPTLFIAANRASAAGGASGSSTGGAHGHAHSHGASGVSLNPVHGDHSHGGAANNQEHFFPQEHSNEHSRGGGSSSDHGKHGDRKTELVCIGQDFDHAAASAALDRCLLTTEEMARGVASWSSLSDPFR